MSQLHEIVSSRAATFDVIFVHGLDGDAFDTWNFRAPSSQADWLANDRPDAAIWSVGYDAASTSWHGASMPLSDRAVNMLALLNAYDLGARPIVFVAHSMGGLVVKQMLREATSTSTEYNAVAKATRGIIFIATPHTGSDLASLTRYLGFFLRSSVALGELQSHAPALRELNRWFRNQSRDMGVSLKVMFETRPTLGVQVVSAS
ncbi:MAG: esterase/lipase family protein, partial [Sciscionella sp.]